MPKFPLYIPTKGRWEYMLTSKFLTRQGVHHTLVAEPDQVEQYQRAVREMKLTADVLALDMTYKERYETCDDLGLTVSTGSGPARNFIWDHSISRGYAWHWVMDDNIHKFMRWNHNTIRTCLSAGMWDAMESFATRYKNVSMAGPHYDEFVLSKLKQAPFKINSRVYSCNLIRNDVPFRWRGRYNEDTILSLDMLKGGWCTILFHAFLQDKGATQRLPGGNSDELYLANKREPGQRYSKEGTIEKSQMLARLHPDVAKVVYRWQRWHHTVDYSVFRNRKLILRDDYVLGEGVNEFGMALKEVTEKGRADG